MLVMNDDYRNAPPLKNKRRSSRGRIINNYLILEDVRDVSVNKAGQHKVIAKCLFCGHVFERPVFVEKLAYNQTVCPCRRRDRGAKAKYVISREKLLRFLTEERNRIEAESFYPEDKIRVLKYDAVLKFLSCKALKNFFKKHLTEIVSGDIMFVTSEKERKNYENVS